MDWPNNEIHNYQTMDQKDGIVNKIRAKLFFTDLHLLGRYMHNGYYFIRHLLNRVWDVLDRGLEGISGEEYNQSALTHCYSLSPRTPASNKKPVLDTLLCGSGQQKKQSTNYGISIVFTWPIKPTEPQSQQNNQYPMPSIQSSLLLKG